MLQKQVKAMNRSMIMNCVGLYRVLEYGRNYFETYVLHGTTQQMFGRVRLNRHAFCARDKYIDHDGNAQCHSK